MRPYTAYALIQTDPRTGKTDLALFDARLPLYWRRHVAEAVNKERWGGEAEIVQVTIRKRGKRRKAA
jgi:hypothetical protein